MRTIRVRFGFGLLTREFPPIALWLVVAQRWRQLTKSMHPTDRLFGCRRQRVWGSPEGGNPFWQAAADPMITRSTE